MAIDTNIKRQSATGLLLLALGTGVLPGPLKVSRAQRHTVTACYAGGFPAIEIMSKPDISASMPSITATGMQPNATAGGAGPSITVVSRGA